MQRFILSLFLLFLSAIVFAQQPLQIMLAKRGEVLVSIDTVYLSNIPKVSSWSIDFQKNGKAIVYLNARQYKILVDLNIPFIPESIPSMLEEFKTASNPASMSTWDSYPNYDTYLAMMKQFTIDYPDLCILDTIGESVEGRLLLALKISDNVKNNEPEPEVFYTSSMHGDELTGYVLMLRLADYLLSNYNKPNIKELVDNLEIFINPLANPDGTFAGGNQSVYGATRFNANNVDLNRNFPDPKGGSHPDGKLWQLENLAMMEYMKNREFSLSMNFHGGIEVLNYPWDTYEAWHADDAWFQLVCKEYVDTVHAISPNYMTDLQNGITNGYDWYEVEGGRQDYMTYFLHGREITAELSTVKLISASQLPQMWENNYRSLLNYLNQALCGIHGLVTDTAGNALITKISILGHDKDSSHVWSQSSGVFYRYLKAGNYNLTFESDGYSSETIQVAVNDFQKTAVEVQMEKLVNISDKQANSLIVFPNPANKYLNIKLNQDSSGPISVTVYSSEGKIVLLKSFAQKDAESMITIDVNSLVSGIYLLDIEQQGSHNFARCVIQTE
jgi:hypothetical protein